MRAVSTALLISAGALWAQQGQPEIRRAIPVEKPQPAPRAVPTPKSAAPALPADDYENPAWMQRVRPAIPVAPAVRPDEEPAFRPEPRQAPQGRIQVDPTPDPNGGEIRV